MFKKFKWFIYSYRKQYTLVLVFLLLSDIVGLIPPYITGVLTDRIFTNSIDMKTFLLVLFVDLLLIGIKYLFGMGWSYFTFRAANEIEYTTRDLLMNKFLKQSMRFFEKNPTGSLMGKTTNDVISLGDLAGYGTLSLIDSTVFPFCIVIIMILVVDFKLTLFSVLPFAVLAYLCVLIGDKVYARWDLGQQAFDRLNGSVLEDVEGIRIIRVFNLQKSRTRAFEEKGQDLCDKNMDVVKYQALMTPIQRIIPAFTFIIAIGYGSYLISVGEITVGQLVSFTYYLNMLIWPMYAVGGFINIYQQGNASMDRIQQVLDYPEDIVEKDSVVALKENPTIEFQHFNFRYPSSQSNVLSDISLRIEKGKTLGVLGKTGAGKTAFLKQLLRLYPTDTEHLLLEGNPIDCYSIAGVREHLGYVPQQHMIFSRTIRDNIRLSKPDATDEEIWEALEIADLKKDLVDFPKGLDTLCGERGISLSGGQKQRIAIARAVLKNPDILILDDSMSAVDAATEKNIVQNIYKNRKGKTTIIACHRISQIKDADEIIVMKDGKISERGNHEELLRAGDWYSEQYRNQISRSRFDENENS